MALKSWPICAAGKIESGTEFARLWPSSLFSCCGFAHRNGRAAVPVGRGAGLSPASTGKAGATLMTAKRGALNRLGYLWTHLGIIVICTGGLLDGSLPVTLQMWWFNKSPLHGNMTIAEVPPEHRLP